MIALFFIIHFFARIFFPLFSSVLGFLHAISLFTGRPLISLTLALICVLLVVSAGLKIEGARREILHEDVLRQYMLPQHYDRLQDIKQYIQTGFIRQVRKDR